MGAHLSACVSLWLGFGLALSQLFTSDQVTEVTNNNWSLSSLSLRLSQVIATSSTSQESFDSLLNFSKKLGKTPVSCKVRTALRSSGSANPGVSVESALRH